MLTAKVRLYPLPTSSWALEIEDLAGMDSRSFVWPHHGSSGWGSHGQVNIKMGKTKAVHGLGLRDRQHWPAVTWMDGGDRGVLHQRRVAGTKAASRDIETGLWLMPSVTKRKNITLVAAVLSICVVDFAINAGRYSQQGCSFQ
jgi:hypothetical protein